MLAAGTLTRDERDGINRDNAVHLLRMFNADEALFQSLAGWGQKAAQMALDALAATGGDVEEAIEAIEAGVLP